MRCDTTEPHQKLAKGSGYREDTSGNLYRSALDCVARAQKFGAPEKINSWLMAGGRKKRKNEDILQPSGNATKSQKKTGSVKSTRAHSMTKTKKEIVQ